MNDRVAFLDLKAQHQGLAGDIETAISRVLTRGWFILGPEVEAFETEFAAALGPGHAAGVGNGTDALALALEALGVGAGDEVITTPLTAVFTALAVSRIGAVPVFADLDDDSLNLSPESVRARITPRTRAIVPVHLYGNPCRLPELVAVAREANLFLVEDACQAHGARLDGRAVGTWGQAGCFSFYPTKNLGAVGDGGLILTQDEELASKLRRMRNGGQSSRCVHQLLGVNSRLDEMQAAVLRAKLPRLSPWNRRRRELAATYRDRLSSAPVRFVRVPAGAEPASHLFVIRTPERDRLQRHLAEMGIETLIHYPIPTHLQPAYRHLGIPEGACPVAEKAAREILSLPLYPEISEAAVERVAAAVRDFFS
jgi:dTDP-4-amino-4,6-dideoxygalactose transaminase